MNDYTFLFRSLRKPATGLLKSTFESSFIHKSWRTGHEFCRERFVPEEYMDEPDDDARSSRVWWKKDPEDGTMCRSAPSRVKDNPHLNYEEYVESPANSTRSCGAAVARRGRDFTGGKFQKSWFGRRWRRQGEYFLVDGGPPEGCTGGNCPVSWP